MTPTATPKSFVQQLTKLMPTKQRADVALILLPSLEAAWGQEGQATTAAGVAAVCCGDAHGLGELPRVSASELWLSWVGAAKAGDEDLGQVKGEACEQKADEGNLAADARAVEEEMLQALQREQDMMRARESSSRPV